MMMLQMFSTFAALVLFASNAALAAPQFSGYNDGDGRSGWDWTRRDTDATQPST